MPFGKLTRMEHSFFTIADLSDMLRVSPGAVRNLITHGEIKAIQIGGRGLWRIEASAFEEYLKRQYEQNEARLASGEALVEE